MPICVHHLYDIQPLDGNDFHSDSDGTSPVCNHRTNAKMAHIHDVTRSKVIENVVSKTQRERYIKRGGRVSDGIGDEQRDGRHHP